MRDIKYKFVVEGEAGKFITRSYLIEELLDTVDYEQVLENLEAVHGCDGNCTNESVNHCECNPLFDDAQITHKLQFTGLKDNNGVEIYEGDISANPFFGAITFNEESASFGLSSDGSNTLSSMSWFANDFGSNDIEIIGDIYSNPELMEDK